MKTGGRASKYETHIEPNLEAIKGWLRSAYTEESIAKRLGVGVSTWKRHKAAQQELKDCVREGQQNAVALVVNSLYKRANGYDYDEVHTEVVDGGPQQQGAGSRPTRRVVKKITKHVPSHVGAICAILFNRDPDKWKNMQNVKHEGDLKLTMPDVTFEFTGEGKDDEG